MKKLFAFSEMAKGFNQYPLSQALDIAVVKGAELMGCKRSCAVLIEEKKELDLNNAYPYDEHITGKIIGEHAAFLWKVIYEYRRVIWIRNPMHDPRTPHLREHAERNKITDIIFAPLLSKEGAIGIMVFDFTVYPAKESTVLAQIIADFVTNSIESVRHREEEMIIRAEREKQICMYPERLQTAHAFRPPLAIIGGLIRSLKKEPLLSDEGKKRISLTEEEVGKLERLTKRTLDHAKYAPQCYNLGIHNVNKSLLHFIEKTRYAGRPHLHFFKFTRDIAIHFDKDKIETCLGDIIQNAAEAGAKNIWMRTKVKAKKKRVLISIVNDGTPIDTTDLKVIFDLFFTTKSHGTGQGLAIAKEIIEGHGGTITAESFIKKKRVNTQKNTEEHGSEVNDKNPNKKKKKKHRKSGSANRTIFKIRLPIRT